MKVSVIIPTYKPGSYIEECIFSLVNQTLPHYKYEIIIILNGCCEPYYSKLKQFTSIYRNHYIIKIIQTELSGVSNARNIGMDVAKGEYICFIDDDDFVSSFYLESLLENASFNTVSVCRPLEFKDGTNNYQPYSITKVYDKNAEKKNISLYKASRFFNGPVYKLIHRDIIANRKFDVRFRNGEDSLFMFLISNKIENIKLADSKAIYYRRLREGSATKLQKSIIYRLKNYSFLILIHCKIYVSDIKGYNVLFFVRTILGRVKSIFLG